MLRVCSSASGHRWEYVSKVSLALLWPSLAWTVLTLAPWRMSKLAKKCLKSCNVISSERPASRAAFRNQRAFFAPP